MPRPLGRALVVGASGNVGGAIEEKYGAANVIGTYKNEARTEDGYVYLDIEAVAEDETLAEEIMTMCRPEVVFICAGFNWVDGCENEAEGLRPRNMNAVGPRNLAVAAKKVGAKVVYFSTDAVFIGNETGKVYAEADEFLPQNKFGETKLLGEQLVTAVCPERTLVIRTAGVFGPERVGKNFVYRMCEAINDADDMAVPTDRFCSHVYNRDLGASHLAPVPVRPRRRGERRSLRTFSHGVSLRPGSLAFNPDAHTSAPFNSASDAFQLHPDVRSRGPSTLSRVGEGSRGLGRRGHVPRRRRGVLLSVQLRAESRGDVRVQGHRDARHQAHGFEDDARPDV